VRPDQDGVPDGDRSVGPASEQRVLHHHDVRPDHHRAEVAGQDGAVQDPASGSDGDVTGDHG
jgi:hypothetical protein